MRIESFQINNFRSFTRTANVPLGSVNVFIGPNNTGKSSVLKALSVLQYPSPTPADIRIGAPEAEINLLLQDIYTFEPWRDLEVASGGIRATVTPEATRLVLESNDGRRFDPQVLSAVETSHFIVPYLSKRKTAGYAEDVRESNAMAVGSDFTHLAAKLSRLGNPGFPAHRRYYDTCSEILGFTVTAVPSMNGQRPGTFLADGRTLPLDQMGEGVPNIVGMLADLALAKGKLFLVEEPENDLHPEALKALLDLLLESAKSNQLVVSTHSNIVARHLGAATGSLLYHVDAERGVMPPNATIKLVAPTPAARIEVLKELGYSFADLDLWDGWILLEEASAERIIRDYLIPWFAPKLTRLRTLATKGNQEVEPTFADFNRLVRFTHLEEAYRDTAWVLVDGDEAGKQIVARLRSEYRSWSPDRFDHFDQPQFEQYYPAEFAEQASAVLAETGKQERRERKKALLLDVCQWLEEDEDRGRQALSRSAAIVIEHLRRIETELPSPRRMAV
ncbi:MAG TPA: AAA family ATPase [Solirubrobacterales bacterium]|nr:AAA family ATPase [Solirubrobacterales bacterium]